MTLKSGRQSQIRPNCYHALRLLGDLDQISSFASNYEPITLPIQPQLVVGILWGNYCRRSRLVDSYISLSWSSFLFAFFSHLLLQQLLPFHQYPPSVDYPWLSAALWLVIKPPLWLVLMCRPFVEMWTLSLDWSTLPLYTLVQFWFPLIRFGLIFLLCLGIPWFTLVHTTGEKRCSTEDSVWHSRVVWNPLAIETALAGYLSIPLHCLRWWTDCGWNRGISPQVSNSPNWWSHDDNDDDVNDHWSLPMIKLIIEYDADSMLFVKFQGKC